jgi:hypothetical protein
MARVSIPNSTYERLQAIAAAHKLSLDAYLKKLARQKLPKRLDALRQLAALESFAASMAAWTSKHVPSGHVVDESRESIYEGRGG